MMTTTINKCILFHIVHVWILYLLHISFLHSLTFPPLDNIFLDCGSPIDSKDFTDRAWKADHSSNSLLTDHNNASVISSVIQPPKEVESVPYATARLSHSQFTYSFSLLTGPKFVRLYFNPSSYPGFNSSSAFFSVQAGQFTLLRNFSAQAFSLEGFSREFCLNVDEETLNITFTPSSDVPDAYAFVNGIEVVSVPVDLYYSKADDWGITVIGENNPLRIETSTAFALMYRINVGGSFISPKDDPGKMFRSWSGDDDDYLTIDESSVLPVNLSIELSFTKISNYSAPENVYRTARSMGMNGTVNLQYDLTWEFQVDSLFTYFIRLHFCEIETPIQKQGDRVFQIYITNQTAQTHADIILWGDKNGVPVYKDYAVLIGAKGNQKVQNLSIALHALPSYESRYSDAILNGIEIFKLSRPDSDLSGPNPDTFPTIPENISLPSPKSTNRATIGAIVGGVLSGFLVLSLLLFLIFRRSYSEWCAFSIAPTKAYMNQKSTLPSDLCRRFSLAEIQEATNNFDRVLVIGVGGFGNVYKGIIDDGSTTVAIKRLNPGSQQGANEFKTEIEMLSKLRYLHLVSLIGYCYENNEMILVYDYMARGTLADHLHKTENPPLSWIQRLQICIGAARGLHYLHSGAQNMIIHRDVKTTNILIDEKWVAKVSDFGLSKIGPDSMSKAHISTVVKGSFGYLDPEYYRLRQLTEKSEKSYKRI